MARRPRPPAEPDPNAIPKGMQRHMDELGTSVPRLYFHWCERNGFAASLVKSKTQRADEIDAFHAALDRRAAEARLHRTPKAFIDAACSGALHGQPIDRPAFRVARDEIDRSNPDESVRASLAEFLNGILKHGDFLFEECDDGPFIRGLIKLHDRKVLWLRDPKAFKPKSKNRDRLFAEFAGHLLDKYGDMPAFMHRVWLRGDRKAWRYRDWYVHLGRDHNLRTAKLPVPMTRRVSHEFLQAPATYSVEQAIRWAQLTSLGARPAVIHAVAGSRIARGFDDDDEFWMSYFRFLIEHPMIDPRQIGPLADFIHSQKFEARQVPGDRPGEFRVEPPPQPGFSFRGRTPETLMRQMGEWHQSLGRIKTLVGGDYEAASFAGFDVTRHAGPFPRHYAIRQLRSAADLIAESDALSHCVSSYHWSCLRGDCTIWSLSRRDGDTGPYRRMVTVEVSDEGLICQARGLANRDPDSEEISVIQAWASAARLQVSGAL
jgi:hypothetical protein